MDSPWDQLDENSVASGDRSLDDMGIVRRTQENLDTPLELVVLRNAALPAYANHLVATVKRMLHHVLAQLPGSTHNADLHGNLSCRA